MKKLNKISWSYDASLIVIISIIVICSDLTPKKLKAKPMNETAAEVVSETVDTEPIISPFKIKQHSHSYNPYNGLHTVHCRIKNSTKYSYSYVVLKATFFGKGGKIIGTGNGVAVNISSGGEKTVDVFGIADNVDSYIVEIDFYEY